MTILMLFIFILFIIIAYFKGKRNLLSPWFLLCSMFLITYSIVLFNYKNWEVRINEKFVLYISTALIAFGIGTLLINKTQVCKSNNRCTSIWNYNDLEFQFKYPVNILMFASLAFAFGYVYKLFSDVSGAGSLTEMLRKIYDNRINEQYTPGFIFNQMSEIVRAIAYLNTYKLFLRFYSKTDKTSFIKIFIPILVLLITALISTDRNIFLRYGIYFVCLWMFFYYNHCKSKNVNGRIIIGIIVIGVIIFILFYIMGKMKLYGSSFSRALSIYGGSGLYNFNLWLETFDEPLKYGQSTFTQFLDSVGVLLKFIGVDLHGSVEKVDAYIKFTSSNGYVYSSNIYSALKPYVEDFGYFGVIFFPFIMGVCYQFLFLKAKKSKCGFSWIAYSLLIYPIIFFPILEQLFRRFHFGFVYEVGWLTILYLFVFVRNKYKICRNKRVTLGGTQKC